MNIEKLKKQLVKHEGIRLKPYTCPAGKLTIGIGRNLEDKGITEQEANFLLINDIEECFHDLLNIFIDFLDLTENRQHALIDMRFNLGPGRFRQFKKMIACIRGNDWEDAAYQLKNSKYFTQVGKRGRDLYDQMLKG